MITNDNCPCTRTSEEHQLAKCHASSPAAIYFINGIVLFCLLLSATHKMRDAMVHKFKLEAPVYFVNHHNADIPHFYFHKRTKIGY